VESKLGPLGTAAIYCPIEPAPGDCEDGELFGGMKIGRENRSTRRKPASAPLCPPQIPFDQTWGWNPGRRGGKPATNRLSYGAAETDVTIVPANSLWRLIYVGTVPNVVVYQTDSLATHEPVDPTETFLCGTPNQPSTGFSWSNNPDHFFCVSLSSKIHPFLW
jgi:hypothetical protein